MGQEAALLLVKRLAPALAVLLGAILLTGYMGGAIATHVRLGEPYIMQVAIGVVIWLGLYLRDPRLRFQDTDAQASTKS